MTSDEIDARIEEIQQKINALCEERSRLTLIQSGYVVTDTEKVEQEKKADEARAAFEVIGKDVILDVTPTVEETGAILEGVN